MGINPVNKADPSGNCTAHATGIGYDCDYNSVAPPIAPPDSNLPPPGTGAIAGAAYGGYAGSVVGGIVSGVCDFYTGGICATANPAIVGVATASGTLAGAWLGTKLDKLGNSLFAKPNNGNAKPHGGPKHNNAIDKHVSQLKNNPNVKNIRKNQQQVDVNGNKVGTNKPDIQYDENGCHYCIEYDNQQINSINHGTVIQANDPSAVVSLFLL